MPLRAVIDGEDKVAPLIDDAEWDALKFAVTRKEKFVMMPCCNAAGRLRVSKLGTKHFYHSQTAECDWKPETAEHLRAKTEILVACRQAGYHALPEKVGADWRADVYAEKGRSKVAFEVQWSRQTLDETKERQEKYSREGVRGCWFFRKPPLEDDYFFKASNNLPIFKLTPEEDIEDALLVTSPALFSPVKRPLTLPDFVTALLERKIRYRSQLTPAPLQRVKIVFLPERCWKCKQWSHVFYVEQPYSSRCGQMMQERQTSLPWGGAEEMHYEFRPEIISSVRLLLRLKLYSFLKIGEIKSRYSRTDERTYMSFGCFHCDALFGNVFLYHQTFPRVRRNGSPCHPSQAEVVIVEPFNEPQAHWCYPEDGNFCDALQST